MQTIEALYKKGVLRIVEPAKITDNIIQVKILNRDEILTEEDMRDILEAKSEKEKGKFYSMDEVFK